MTVDIFHDQSPRKNVAGLGGVEPATSWSPVGRRFQLSRRGHIQSINPLTEKIELA